MSGAQPWELRSPSRRASWRRAGQPSPRPSRRSAATVDTRCDQPRVVPAVAGSVTATDARLGHLAEVVADQVDDHDVLRRVLGSVRSAAVAPVPLIGPAATGGRRGRSESSGEAQATCRPRLGDRSPWRRTARGCRESSAAPSARRVRIGSGHESTRHRFDLVDVRRPRFVAGSCRTRGHVGLARQRRGPCRAGGRRRHGGAAHKRPAARPRANRAAVAAGPRRSSRRPQAPRSPARPGRRSRRPATRRRPTVDDGPTVPCHRSTHAAMLARPPSV